MNLADMKNLTKEEQDKLHSRITMARHSGKTAVYSSQYGAGAKTIARSSGVSVAVGELLHKAYWEINKGLKVLESECVVKTEVIDGVQVKWLYNPINGLWYNLKTDKDKVSALIQGTGAFLFDMWVKEIKKRDVKILGAFHDEVIIEIPKGYQAGVRKYLEDCIGKVNKEWGLDRDLGVDVIFGNSYRDIH